VRDNRADDGGGIWNGESDFQDTSGTVTVSTDSSVIGNTPDDCYGTTAC
jgi:hypothetical protein